MTGVVKTTGGIQVTLTIFAVGLPSVVFVVFALFLWFKPQALYPPTDYRPDLHPQESAKAMRSISPELLEFAGPIAQSPPATETEGILDDSLKSPPAPAQDVKSPDNNHFLSMMNAFFHRNLTDAETAYKKLQASETDPDNKLFHEALYLNSRYERGDASALTKLRDLAEATQAHIAIIFLGHCYRYSKDYAHARDIYERAQKAADSEQERVRSAILLAYCDRDLNEVKRGLKTVSGLIVDDLADDSKRQIYETIAELEDACSNDHMHALSLDKASHYKPHDIDLRFKAAYAQSNAGLNRLAATNYEVLLQFAPDHAIALNNLDLPPVSVPPTMLVER